jgi:hypothetical protein
MAILDNRVTDTDAPSSNRKQDPHKVLARQEKEKKEDNYVFIPRTSAKQTTTPTPLIANPRAPRVDAMNLFKDLSSKLAHPTSLLRELDKRMQLFQEGQKFEFLQNKRYPATVGLMIEYIINLLKVKRPTATQAPISSTLESMEASKRYSQFFQEGTFCFSSLASLMSRTLLKVHIFIPWKVSASIMLIGSKPTPQFRSTASNVSSIATTRLTAI